MGVGRSEVLVAIVSLDSVTSGQCEGMESGRSRRTWGRVSAVEGSGHCPVSYTHLTLPTKRIV